MINTVIFDLGGVLINWNPRHLYRKLLKSEAEVEHFLANVCTQAWNEQQDAGRSLAEGTRLLVEQHPQHAPLIEAYYGRWEEMLGGAIEGTVDILAALRASPHNLFALTNFSAETFPIAQRHYPFLDWFQDILVSGAVGLKKPDPKIFQMLFEQHKLDPEGAVFIDDSLPNVEAATAQGVKAIHFKTPEQLREALRKLSVL